ncbi:hypothetical protein BT63DRAFT_298071 [Microthyrium microscopicum]|uniref:Uncharacterized protein n=1 Tax=Microthyrium microscopicum TaxID=703497 RepID=A0A6A6U9V4_9PEZI|nr:hypothetical protein BT63DRAFT_298071 [Microthyrium microscopicum]
MKSSPSTSTSAKASSNSLGHVSGNSIANGVDNGLANGLDNSSTVNSDNKQSPSPLTVPAVADKKKPSPSPSLKRDKAEKLLKEHGSPPGVRVTAGGRIVPTDVKLNLQAVPDIEAEADRVLYGDHWFPDRQPLSRAELENSFLQARRHPRYPQMPLFPHYPIDEGNFPMLRPNGFGNHLLHPNAASMHPSNHPIYTAHLDMIRGLHLNGYDSGWATEKLPDVPVANHSALYETYARLGNAADDSNLGRLEPQSDEQENPLRVDVNDEINRVTETKLRFEAVKKSLEQREVREGHDPERKQALVRSKCEVILLLDTLRKTLEKLTSKRDEYISQHIAEHGTPPERPLQVTPVSAPIPSAIPVPMAPSFNRYPVENVPTQQRDQRTHAVPIRDPLENELKTSTSTRLNPRSPAYQPMELRTPGKESSGEQKTSTTQEAKDDECKSRSSVTTTDFFPVAPEQHSLTKYEGTAKKQVLNSPNDVVSLTFVNSFLRQSRKLSLHESVLTFLRFPKEMMAPREASQNLSC